MITCFHCSDHHLVSIRHSWLKQTRVLKVFRTVCEKYLNVGWIHITIMSVQDRSIKFLELGLLISIQITKIVTVTALKSRKKQGFSAFRNIN